MLEDALNNYKGDVYLYFGEISRYGYEQISDILSQKNKPKNNACLILCTYGGNPDAGYRMARALRHHYKKLDVLVPDLCKSAGTLMCIGADRLIIGDRGELGPLDIQIAKPDEMFESMSGLELIQAMSAMKNQMLVAFRQYLVDIRQGSRIKTKMAADIATKLAEGFISPIAAKIDPVTLGEHQRAMQIGYEYGSRLNDMSEALKVDALDKLVSDYPAHGFVIDRKEAASLFKQVDKPADDTQLLYEWIKGIICERGMPEGNPIILDLQDIISDKKKNDETKTTKSTRPKVKRVARKTSKKSAKRKSND